MGKLTITPIREEDVILPSALTFLKGGVTAAQCTINNCGTDFGSCSDINECGKNTVSCEVNRCVTKLNDCPANMTCKTKCTKLAES